MSLLPAPPGPSAESSAGGVNDSSADSAAVPVTAGPVAAEGIATALCLPAYPLDAPDPLLRATLAAVEAALERDPADAMAHNCRAMLLAEFGRTAEACAAAGQAVALAPDHPAYHFNASCLLLQAGRYQEGFAEHEWRRRVPELPPASRDYPIPEWHGEPLTGRVLLVYGEQGYGDTLQMLRYLPLLAGRGARLICDFPVALKRLVAGLPGVELAASAGDRLPPFDYHVSVHSLPQRFGTTLDSIPAAVPYLAAAPELIRAWRQRLGPPDLPRVGLVWAGNPAHLGDRRRTLTRTTLAPLLAVPGVRLYALQVTPPGADAADPEADGPLPEPIQDLGPALGDFAETAAALAALDLVVTVDTAMAHLAGALGRPVWVMLPFHADWRWLTGRSDSPWYPTARLFRQPTRHNWDPVVAEVAAALTAWAGTPAASAGRSTVAPRPELAALMRQRRWPEVEAACRSNRSSDLPAADRPPVLASTAFAPTTFAEEEALAVALWKQGRAEEAVARLGVWVDAGPVPVSTRYTLAYALARAGRPADAERQYLRVLCDQPDHAYALNNLGNLAKAGARLAEAA